MKINTWTASALAAVLLATAPAMAGDDWDCDKDHDHSKHAHAEDARYRWTLEPGEAMLFKHPVSFVGEVIDTTNSHRLVRAANGMNVMIPNMALLWNGDSQMFAQDTGIGDDVVIHMRQEENYRVMDTMGTLNPMVAVGSYDGVFFFPEEFIEDIALGELDRDIVREDYDDDTVADYAGDSKGAIYDVDLYSVDQ